MPLASAPRRYASSRAHAHAEPRAWHPSHATPSGSERMAHPCDPAAALFHGQPLAPTIQRAVAKFRRSIWIDGSIVAFISVPNTQRPRLT